MEDICSSFLRDRGWMQIDDRNRLRQFNPAQLWKHLGQLGMCPRCVINFCAYGFFIEPRWIVHPAKLTDCWFLILRYVVPTHQGSKFWGYINFILILASTIIVRKKSVIVLFDDVFVPRSFFFQVVPAPFLKDKRYKCIQTQRRYVVRTALLRTRA